MGRDSSAASTPGRWTIVTQPEHGQHGEPDDHHRAEERADAAGAAPLDAEQADQDDARVIGTT